MGQDYMVTGRQITQIHAAHSGLWPAPHGAVRALVSYGSCFLL